MSHLLFCLAYVCVWPQEHVHTCVSACTIGSSSRLTVHTAQTASSAWTLYLPFGAAASLLHAHTSCTHTNIHTHLGLHIYTSTWQTTACPFVVQGVNLIQGVLLYIWIRVIWKMNTSIFFYFSHFHSFWSTSKTSEKEAQSVPSPNRTFNIPLNYNTKSF